jgi:putative Mg2+ transporter-C (MgtC) family protein
MVVEEGTVTPEILHQIDILGRLVLSAMLGGLIGLERELHAHPAGTRTHLLVSLGAATFTVLSIFAFDLPPGSNGATPTDPSRVAAQVVSGIGFLGAGAILKYGSTIKGLTTAASLWASAAIGMAAGAGSWVVAVGGSMIIMVSLWPLHALLDRLREKRGRRVRLQLTIADLAPLAQITTEAARRRIEIAAITTERIDGNGYEIRLELGLPPGAVATEVIEAYAGLEGVRLLGARRPGDRDED